MTVFFKRTFMILWLLRIVSMYVHSVFALWFFIV